MNPNRLIIAALCLILYFPASAQAQEMDKELSDMATTLAARSKESGKTKVTVLDFTDLQGGSSELGKYVAEQLTVNLVMVKKDFSVLDRANLKKILAEHKLTATGLIDPETAKKLGQFAGVDALILGTIVSKGQKVSVTAKIITTDTAEIVGAAKAEFRSDETIQGLISKPAEEPKSSKGEEAEDKTKVSKTLGDLRVELQSLRVVNGKNYLLSMTLANQNPKKSIWVALHAERSNMLKSRITDSNGTEFLSLGGNTATGIEIAPYYKDPYQSDTFSPATEIAPNESISATVTFFSMGGQRATSGECSVQLQLLLGHDLGGNKGTVKIQNFTSKLPAN